MPFDINSVADLNCIFILWSGRFSRVEVDAYVREAAALPGFQGTASLFHDFRRVDLNIPSAEMRSASRADLPPCHPETVRRSAILVSSKMAFGMSRILATFRTGPGLVLEVFDDLEDAKAWLGLPAGIGDPFADMRRD